MGIISPITGLSNVRLVGKISAKTIIRRYKRFFQIDVSRFFKNLDEVNTYECLDSGYIFFHPFGLEGDSDFYGHFKDMSWYYMDWKWEYKEALAYVQPGTDVLEIGCAKGAFLKKMAGKGARAVGLELSKDAALAGRNEGLRILEESIEEHAKNNPGKYDFICFFQVLEHVEDVRGFMEAAKGALKPGGKIFVSVPNNGSFVSRDRHPSLNLPPHHAGLWNHRSLLSLGHVFSLETENILIEPLQDYHLPFYYQVNYGYDVIGMTGRIIGKVLNKLARPAFCIFLKPFSRDMIGHTIAAVYKKADKTRIKP